MKKSKWREVRGLLTLFGLSIFAAAGLTALMVYRYGPTGNYIAGNTILAPSTLQTMNYNDLNPKTNSRARYSFNGTEFSYFDKMEGKMRQVPVNPAAYNSFYNLVASNSSVEPKDEIISEFHQVSPVTLTSTVRSDNAEAMQMVKIFQIIQFTETDYFRVQLRGQNETGDWAYFYQPNIYNTVMRLFTKN